MQTEDEFTVELRNGRIFVNGAEYESVVDLGRRVYTGRTNLKITGELVRLVTQAIADGRLIERHAAAEPDRTRRLVRVLPRTES